MSKKIAVINGPNLNLLGKRDSDVYGTCTLEQIVESVEKAAKEMGLCIQSFQSNSEGEIVDAIHKALEDCEGIIINPGAYTHTSVAIRDALECSKNPVIEVHLSNIFAREDFRKHSFVSEVASGIISGFGAKSYLLALEALAELVESHD